MEDTELNLKLVECLRQASYQINEFNTRMRTVDPDKIEDVKKALKQVAYACIRALSEDENL